MTKTPVAQAVQYYLAGASSYSTLSRRWRENETYTASAEEWTELQKLRSMEDPTIPMFLKVGEAKPVRMAKAMSEEKTGDITIHHDRSGEDGMEGLNPDAVVVGMDELLEDDAERTVDLSDLDDDTAEVALRPGATITKVEPAGADTVDGAATVEAGDESVEESVEEAADAQETDEKQQVTSTRRAAPKPGVVVKRKVVKASLPPAPPAADSEKTVI